MAVGLAAFGYAVITFAGGDSSSTAVATSAATTSAEPTTEARPNEERATEAPQVGPAPVPAEPTWEPLFGPYVVEIVDEFERSPDGFTQGLEWVDGRLLHSTGQRGESERQWIDLETGAVETSAPLDDSEFGEGITIVGDEIFQLTWTSERLLVSDATTLELLRTVPYQGEGWGICHDGDSVVTSDGSSTLSFRDPESFDVQRQVTVVDANDALVTQLNELECVGGQVLANIWQTDTIVAIDPATGAVDATIDASALRPASTLPTGDDADENVLNGIAAIPEDGTALLTGKRWPVIYEVRFVPS